MSTFTDDISTLLDAIRNDRHRCVKIGVSEKLIEELAQAEETAVRAMVSTRQGHVDAASQLLVEARDLHAHALRDIQSCWDESAEIERM
jgi:hypothetical protein